MAHHAHHICSNYERRGFHTDFHFQMLRWTPNFDPNFESHLIPVWIFLPGLLIQDFQESYLRMFVNATGQSVEMDNPTRVISRQSGARICVKVDVYAPLPSQFWFDVAGAKCRWQDIIYENVPIYCTSCRHLGQRIETCLVNHKKKDVEIAKTDS